MDILAIIKDAFLVLSQSIEKSILFIEKYRLVNLFVIAGVIISAWTLYLNFLKSSQPDLKIGKVILVWHDNMLDLAPMIDAFCTFENKGARAITIDSVEIELYKNKNKEAEFYDYLFLKISNYAHYIETQDIWKNLASWMQDEYSHPIVVNKYSEVSKMIGFKGKDSKYEFAEGEYKLKIRLFSKNKFLVEKESPFRLTAIKAVEIKNKKTKRLNEATEIELEL